MRTSISFLTTTSAIAPLARVAGVPHTLDVLGFDREHRTVYFVEQVGGATPLVHVMHVDGEHAGRMTPARALHDELGPRIGEAIAALRARLEPLDPIDADAYLLTTRVIQRRALRVPGGTPIRKFTLTLAVEPIVGDGDPRLGKTAVTAYLRARAALDRVWLVPGTDLAIARITYLGVPSDVGHDKQTAVLTQRAA